MTDPFKPTTSDTAYLDMPPNKERTDPNIVLARLKASAVKNAKGNKINFALVLTMVGMIGAFAVYMLNATNAAAQSVVAPVEAQVIAGDAAFEVHVQSSKEVHKEIKEQLKSQGNTLHDVELKQVRIELMLERVSDRVGAAVPPPVKTDGGA